MSHAGKIITYTGKLLNPFNMSPDDVDIRDIAKGLSNVCRYGGQCGDFYSVAEHSVLLAGYVIEHLGPVAARYALLHDAHEAYVGDIPAPLQTACGALERAAEEAIGVQDTIALRYFGEDGAEYAQSRQVCLLDKAIRIDEMIWLFRGSDFAHTLDRARMLHVPIYCWSPTFAHAEYLAMFSQLFPEDLR